MKRILLVSAYQAAFVKRDFEILSKAFAVKPCWGSELKKNMINYLLIFAVSSWEVFRSDLVYCWFADFRAHSAVWWAKLFGKKSVVVIGGYEFRELSQSEKPRTVEKRTSHFLFCLRNADLLIAVSDDYRERMAEVYPQYAHRIARIYNAIKLPDPAGIKKQEKENLIITVCQGEEVPRLLLKGLDLFIDTAARLPMFQFAIIGVSGRLQKKITSLMKSDNLLLIPQLRESELISWYARARIYCQFSRYESFGLALVEAMSWECIPIVAPLASLIERIGHAGYVMKKRDAEEAAQLILTALDSGAEMGKMAAKWAKENFALNIREQQLLTVLHKVLDSDE